MRGNEVPASSDSVDVEVRRWLKAQRDDLINMSRTNRLLYFRHTKTASLEIEAPGPAEVLDRLSRGGVGGYWNIYRAPQETDDPKDGHDPRPNELVIAGKDANQIDRGLHQLERRTNHEFVEKGLWILYLGLGMVNWLDSDSTDQPGLSPLLLVPVTIARDSLREPFRLRRTEDDPVINPALAVKLESDFDLRLPTVDDFEQDGFEGVIRRTRELVRGRRGWSVEQRAVLCPFTFQKEAMYRDLLTNEDELATDPMIQLLALGPDAPSAGDFDFEPCPEYQLDHRVAPEDLVSIRDADATQRACILAARDGHSFVMDGPPGSGKSQTITNIIAELMHAGKTVLFVSEKAAALDVVHNRLREAHLDEFVLRLHSHNATRKSVASELGSALSSRPSAREAFTPAQRADLARRRTALSAYAQALNEIRQPLGRSLHDVLGSISALHEVPHSPVPNGFGLGLSIEQFTAFLDIAGDLGRAWGPVERGDDFLWRDLKDATFSASRKVEIERDLEVTLSALAALRSRVEAIDAELGLGWYDGAAAADRLHGLLESLDEKREIPTAWLSMEDLQPVIDRYAALSEKARAYSGEVDALRTLLGPRAEDLRTSVAHDVESATSKLNACEPRWQPDPELAQAALRGQARFLADSPDVLDAMAADAHHIADTFSLPSEDLTLSRARELADLGDLVDSATRPEATWLNPAVQASLNEAVQVLGELLNDFRQKKDDLRDIFTNEVLALDVASIHVRFTDVHRGMGKIRRAYREDKRTLAACTVAGAVTKQVRSRLADAVRWKEVSDLLTAAEARHAATLGEHYYQRAEADFSRISSAVEVARQALRLAGDGHIGRSFAQQLALGSTPDPAVPNVARRLTANIDAWLSTAHQVLGQPAKRLRTMPIHRIREWCARVATELATLSSAVEHVNDIAGNSVSLGFAAKALARAAKADELREAIDTQFDAGTQPLGRRFVGVHTDWQALNDDLGWARTIRAKLGEPVRPQVADAILAASFTPADLRDQLGEWRKTRARVLGQFTPVRADRLAGSLDETFDDARELLHRLVDSITDIDEWEAYTSARSRLERHGLQPVVVFCEERSVPGDQVRRVVERALLEAWADDVIAADAARLGAMRAPDRDAIVTKFHELDARQVSLSAACVIKSCADRRPNSVIGEAAIIKRQAELKRRHMPIRTLLDKAGSVAQRLKPCFMMSPLSVSQYLPPSFRFDVVIFDEASQVRPCDAVNCVYRGTQLIVAGDQKQLPPSSFFTTISDSDDDTYDDEQLDVFDSVLDLCKGAGGLRSLPLRWHYRSQHESLITYSNYSFYDGKLLTFPGARHEGPDVGIELFHVNGVYRRGSTRDNPIEAAKVIERVLHHRRTHPKLTLGVVTFSTTQEEAIAVELERQAREHAELAELQSEDRLHGFFIKNLENVQGDERDVIIFSVGYGPDELGKFTLNMGPLNKKGGERRLNVAITRARTRVEIVTSVLPGEFPPEVMADGVRHLKRYLDFARRGMPALAIDLAESRGDAESPFEEEVLRVIKAWGYDVVPQVGFAGYRIDIGIRNPAQPGSYALGVECDGAMYHSSKVARDRDRLRQDVLERLGWRIHRIWGTAWYRDRAGQEARLKDVIAHAITSSPPEPAIDLRPAVEMSIEDVDFDGPPEWTEPYRMARLARVSTAVEMHWPEARSQLRHLIEEVVRQEGPVHEDLVLRAVRQAWGVERAGARIKEAFRKAVRDLTRTGLQRDKNGFLRTTFSAMRKVRIPTDDPATRREARHIPQEELQLAMAHIARDANTVSGDELTRHVARLFGWQRRGPDVQAALDEATEALVQRGDLKLHE